MTAKDIVTHALALPRRQRARLAERLLESLDGKPEQGVLEAWLDEAERRYAAYKQGQMGARPVSEVLRDIRRKLR